ncbi:MAG TPA: hypothetical protein VF037_02865 [Gemmatimonadales bacterium]
MATLSRLFVLALVLVAPACSTGAADPPEQPAPAPDGQNGRLDVSNRSSTDMDVYAVRSGQRIRLGTAPGGETSRFTLSPGVITGGGTVYFEAVPTRQVGVDSGGAIRTDNVQVRGGDVITLDVPPQ